ncbi:hypothetical protein COT79_01355, partial [Candidatus Berkelbacteria bacterium CG10_big_fil_rev_8_21_14_0_10_43_14]
MITKGFRDFTKVRLITKIIISVISMFYVWQGVSMVYAQIPPPAITPWIFEATPPVCSPASQTITLDHSTLKAAATLTATEGDGTYTWIATGSEQGSGVGSVFQPTYSQVGTFNVSVTSGGQVSNTCAVTVNAALNSAPNSVAIT